jgi:hypothetical protein
MFYDNQLNQATTGGGNIIDRASITGGDSYLNDIAQITASGINSIVQKSTNLIN